ncbi:MAG: alpha-mannosidase [Armatimonadota bacterium]
MPTNDTFYFIAHTHWEGAVFEPREKYLQLGLPNILRALALLKAYPAYRFTLDQACYVKPFLERYPEEEAAFRLFVQEGRLAIVGGTDVMLDVNMPGGESFVRQVLYGKGYFREKLGVDVTAGWQLDTFGHHAQMPQLLKLAGFTSFWFFRGVPGWETPSEFAWEGLDGSRIPAFWLPHAYANVYGSPKTLPEFTEFMTKAYDALAPFSRDAGRVGLAGIDVGEPEPHVPRLVEEFNRQPDRPFDLRLAVPADYEAAVAQRGELPVVGGELNPIFQGIYSSRIELKQRTRELETMLTDAEKLGAVLRALGTQTDDAILWDAWEPMLFNQAHDLMSGVMTDHVYEDTIRGYDFAQRIAGEQVDARLRELTAHIDTRGDGIPLVVCNTLGWPRTDVVAATVSFTDPGIHGVVVIGPEGEIPSQLSDEIRQEDGSLLQATVTFLARDVPALGYAVYHVNTVLVTAAVPKPLTLPVLENEFYRLEIDQQTGAITQITVKEGGWDALAGPANVVAMEEDKGDFWELYRPLDAGSRIAMTERHEPPQPGAAVLSTERIAEPGTVAIGPVFSEFTVRHPFSENGEFETTIRLYQGLRRVDIRTTILNQDEAVRYRALFPTSIEHGKNVQEIPFGAIERPDGIEFPAQHWVDISNDQVGVALLNRGLPGHNIAGGTLMLSLLRSTRIVAYGYGGGYAPGMTSDTGLELGKEMTFDYALLPHAGDWRQAGVYRDGQAFNHPLLACPAAPHPGALPKRWELLAISPDNIILSSLKTGKDGKLVLRVYEAAGTATDATLSFTGKVIAAEELNLMEDAIGLLEMVEGRLRVALHPFEIKTIGITIG